MVFKETWERELDSVGLTAAVLAMYHAVSTGRNTYLAGGVEITTLITVDTIVEAGCVETEVTVEVT